MAFLTCVVVMVLLEYPHLKDVVLPVLVRTQPQQKLQLNDIVHLRQEAFKVSWRLLKEEFL